MPTCIHTASFLLFFPFLSFVSAPGIFIELDLSGDVGGGRVQRAAADTGRRALFLPLMGPCHAFSRLASFHTSKGCVSPA